MERSKPSTCGLVNVRLLISGLLIAAFPVGAFQSLETAYRRNGGEVVEAFEAQRQVLQKSSAVMLNKRRELAYGVVISADGWILTKASEIAGVENLWVRVDEQTYREVRVLAMDDDWDVALVKIEATGLQAVVYAPTSDIPQGTWVVANGVTSLKTRRALAGIISAKIREIPEGGGNMGISLKEDAEDLVIDELAEDGGASVAGLKKGDILLMIDDQKVLTFEDVSEILKKRRPGMEIEVTYLRRGEARKARLKLDPGPLTRNDQMSGIFSLRRSGFPRVLQHDIIANKSSVGGPLLDLDGRCLGMNIARANRAESFAIPVEDLKELAERLMKTAAGTSP